jgi:hypothetical protein
MEPDTVGGRWAVVSRLVTADDDTRWGDPERQRIGRILYVVGIVGAIAALVAGMAGWLLAGRAARSLADTLDPIAGIVANVSDTVDASLVMLDRTAEAIEGIESATGSTARTLDSVSEVVAETSGLVGGGIADGLDSAVETMPALVDTGRVIDRTMRTLSLVGVDYDPEVPLDESLAELEESLRPIPDQLRDQVALLTEVRSDIEQIVTDAASLSAVLLETRIDLMEARVVLESASDNAAAAVVRVAEIRSEVATYDTLARVMVVSVTVALLAAASAPFMIGLHYRRSEERTG